LRDTLVPSPPQTKKKHMEPCNILGGRGWGCEEFLTDINLTAIPAQEPDPLSNVESVMLSEVECCQLSRAALQNYTTP